MAKIDSFPNIRHIAIEIAYDNGMVHRDSTEQDFINSTDVALGADGVYEADLRVLDEWIGTLTDEQKETLAVGEETEMQAVANMCPQPWLCGIFYDIFEGLPATTFLAQRANLGSPV